MNKHGLFRRERPLSALVHSGFLGQGDPFSLPLLDQFPFELRDSSHDAQEQVCHRRVLPGEGQAFFDEANLDALAGQLLHQQTKIVLISREPVHRVTEDCIAFPDELDHPFEPRPIAVPSGHLVREPLVQFHAVELANFLLVERAHTKVADPKALPLRRGFSIHCWERPNRQ